MFICFSVWTYFNGYYYCIFYKRKSLFPHYESFPSLTLMLLHSLHCVFHFLAHPWCLSYLSFFLCQSKSSVSLPYSHSLLLGIVFFSPCFLPWSQLALLFSLSALLPLFFPVFLRIFFPSLPIPTVLTQLSQQHALEQSRCQILTATAHCAEDDSTPMARLCCATISCFNHIFCHAAVVCLSFHACIPAISCLSSSAKVCMVEMVAALKRSPLLQSACPGGLRHWPLEHCLKIINNAGWHANLALANQG